MMHSTQWREDNRAFLQSQIRWTGTLLSALAQHPEYSVEALHESPGVCEARAELERYREGEIAPALDMLAEFLGFTVPERDLVAICLACELDPEQAQLCSALHQNVDRRTMTLGLASALLPDITIEMALASAPLRFWRVITLERQPSEPLIDAALVLDERILDFLVGTNAIDRRLANLLVSYESPIAPHCRPDSYQQTADALVPIMQSSMQRTARSVVRLCGGPSASAVEIASGVAEQVGLQMLKIDSAALPPTGEPLADFARLLWRENRLQALAVYIRHGDAAIGQRRLRQLLSSAPGVYFIESNEPIGIVDITEYTVDVAAASPTEQSAIWSAELGDSHTALSADLAEQFSLDTATILRLSHEATLAEDPKQYLWRACRQATRSGLDGLADRIYPKASWDDLILPSQTKSLLRSIVDQVTNRRTVYDEWGYRKKLSRGLGVSALFSGDSGTGKTMSAEVIAHSLDLDLYRIDLSAVVSKYIGETAKNIKAIFSAAETSGAILLFDEADAIFGKRTEVKDSHDRYANVDIAYLLQRMEAYSGLAILSSNFRKALDHAFTRRLRFIVQFERPDFDERLALWRIVFPSGMPIARDFDPERLAALQLTGGSIQSIAMQAGFMAAAAGHALDMPLILAAARLEFEKLQLPAKDTLFRASTEPRSRVLAG